MEAVEWEEVKRKGRVWRKLYTQNIWINAKCFHKRKAHGKYEIQIKYDAINDISGRVKRRFQSNAGGYNYCVSHVKRCKAPVEWGVITAVENDKFDIETLSTLDSW